VVKRNLVDKRFGDGCLDAKLMEHQVRLEILTVKSDDVIGELKLTGNQGESMPEPGLPESFNVCMNERSWIEY
jgi:hypothetical protein